MQLQPLTPMEKKICADMGTSEEDYAIAKAKRVIGAKMTTYVVEPRPVESRPVESRPSQRLAQGRMVVASKPVVQLQPQPTDPAIAAMVAALTPDERKICAAQGNSLEDYVRAKARRAAGIFTVERPRQSRFAGPASQSADPAIAVMVSALTPEERKICADLGNSLEDYARAKAKRAAAQGGAMNRRETVHSIVGDQINRMLGPVFAEMRSRPAQ